MLNRKGSHLLFVFSLLLSGPALLAPRAAQAADMRCSIMRHVFAGYLKHHLGFQDAYEEYTLRIGSQYILGLDPSKSILLRSDVGEIRNLLAGSFEKIRSGDCASLSKVQAIASLRAAETEAYVREFLDSSASPERSEEITPPDPKSRDFPKDEAEKRKLLIEIAQFQISKSMRAGTSFREAKDQILYRYKQGAKQFKEKEQKLGVLLGDYTHALSSALDPHTSYFTKENLEDFKIQLQLSLEGIGASLSSVSGHIVTDEIVPGGSAARHGVLRVKDRIIAVAEEGKPAVSVLNMELNDVVRLIRGKPGTSVVLSVLRLGAKKERFEVSIKREKVDLSDQAAKIVYQEHKKNGRSLKIAVIAFTSFYGGSDGGRSSSADVKQLVADAVQKHVDGIVLDLSMNHGGSLEEVVKIAGLFIPKGPVVATQNSNGKVEILAHQAEKVLYTGPLLICTSRESASAAEILSGALRAYGRVVLAGNDRTHGKGTVQTLIHLAEFGGMKITTGMYFLPNGDTPQNQGVLSDILLPTTLAHAETGEAKLEYSLAPRKIKPFLPKDLKMTVDSSLLSKLIEGSKTRLRKRVELDAGRSRKIATDVQKTQDQLLNVQESVNIMADWITYRS